MYVFITPIAKYISGESKKLLNNLAVKLNKLVNKTRKAHVTLLMFLRYLPAKITLL